MKKAMKKTCACFMAAVSIITAAASPLYAQEANENAVQMTEEQAKAAAAQNGLCLSGKFQKIVFDAGALSFSLHDFRNNPAGTLR